MTDASRPGPVFSMSGDAAAAACPAASLVSAPEADARAGETDLELARRGPAAVRRPPVALFGAIDVGTNSIHLVMVEISPEGDFRILGREKEMVQLGKGGFARHVLTSRAMSDGVNTLKRFIKMARLKGIGRLRAVATSAVREARNGGDFVRRVQDELGLDLHVISAEEEARLIYLAVRHAVDCGDGDNLIADIGGGSLEIIIGNESRSELLFSVKLGASRLAELFLHSDPPAANELKALRQHVERQLAPVMERIGRRRIVRGIVTSGTIENVATICAYRRGTREIEPFTQLRIRRSELKGLIADLSGLSREERSRVPGLDARRVEAIVPAGVVLHMLMRKLDLDEVEYCEMALREGVIIDHIARHRVGLRARATWPDPRPRSVFHLAERCNYRAEHAEQVARLALSLFDQLAGLHRLDARYREMLRFACLLHDVGYLISHESHHKHSYYLIRNGGLQGFHEAEIELIANLARYHRKGRPKKSHYSFQNLAGVHRPVLRRLIPLIRLANALDRTHYSVVESLACRVLPDRVSLHVHARRDAELELWTASLHRRLFERQFGVPLEIVPAVPASEDKTYGRSE